MSQGCTWEQTKSMIVIDFEGEGEKQDGTIPDPILLGAWGPFDRDGRMKYKAWLLDPRLKPIVNTRKIPGQKVLANLEEAVSEILEIAKSRGLLVGTYSEHERKIIQNKAPLLLDRFKGVWVNIKTVGARECTLRDIDQKSNSLNDIISALNTNVSPSISPRGGAANACRIIMRGAHRSGRWGRWTAVQREMARELIRYNIEDVKAAWKVLRHCCWRERARRQKALPRQP